MSYRSSEGASSCCLAAPRAFRWLIARYLSWNAVWQPPGRDDRQQREPRHDEQPDLERAQPRFRELTRTASATCSGRAVVRSMTLLS